MTRQKTIPWAGLFVYSGLTTTEVAALLDVSRVTVSKWKNKRVAEISKALYPRVANFAELVQTAIDEGRLPVDLGSTTPLEERLTVIRRALRMKK